MITDPYAQVLVLLQVISAYLDHFPLLGPLFSVHRIWILAEMILQGFFKLVAIVSVKKKKKPSQNGSFLCLWLLQFKILAHPYPFNYSLNIAVLSPTYSVLQKALS